MSNAVFTGDSDSAASCNIAIIGAGLAGLSCARKLSIGCPSDDLKMHVYEATDRVGGRVRSDVVDGFTLDHGFQVLLTAYPACRDLLDYEALRLRAFEPGALIRKDGRFRRLGDPWRRPLQAVSTALSPVGTLADKLRIAKLRWLASKGSLEDLYQRESESTADRLREMGFSYAMVDEFFRPFLGGVYLDETLATSSRMLEFVFRMFAAGDIAVPADGMAAIPRQLADGLPRGTLQFRSSITALEPDGDRTRLRFADGSETVAQTVVLATESNAAARLLQQPELETGWNETTNLYFTANRSPNTERLLMLRGDEQDGPIQTAVVLSDVAPEYANDDKALISVSVSQAVCDDEIEDLSKAVIGQAEEWFGSDATRWKFLRAFRVPYGLPTIPMETVLQPIRPTIIGGRIYRCGDYLESPSIQGAMNSGMRVAEHLLTQSRI